MSEEERERILLVDDDAGLRRAVERVLSPLYRVETAGGVAEAEARLAAGAFALALVDIQLGDGDGYALCHELRRRSPETDVILITGSVSNPDEKLYRSLEEGAFYFLFKPFERRVLRALVERCLRLQRERHAKERYARALGEDLEKARRFQRSLLPREAVEAGGWHVDGRFLACDALGGDFYLALPERDGGLAVAVADVVGHGVSAAMYAGMLRSTLDAARRRDPDPARLLPDLLSGIDFFEGSRYATMIYARLFPDGRLSYFSAGHPPALCWRRESGHIEHLASTGLLLTTALPHRPSDARQLRLVPGDRLLVATDGVFEARDPSDRELGLSAVEETFAATGDLAVAAALDRLLERLREHCGGRPLTDDATLLLVERTAG